MIGLCEFCAYKQSDCKGNKDLEKLKCEYYKKRPVQNVKQMAERIAELEKENAMLRKATPSAEAEWIPCSERLPEAEDMYQPPEQRYLCQLEAYGERKFCVLSRLKGAVSPFWDWYGVAVHDYEVTAWMPLPEPYKAESEDEK